MQKLIELVFKIIIHRLIKKKAYREIILSYKLEFAHIHFVLTPLHWINTEQGFLFILIIFLSLWRSCFYFSSLLDFIQPIWIIKEKSAKIC